jgi:hypothetical protein
MHELQRKQYEGGLGAMIGKPPISCKVNGAMKGKGDTA